MNKLKESRPLSLLIILIIYVIAAAIGITVYLSLEIDWWLALLIADVSSTVTTFIFSLIFKNASVYDPYWSVQPPVILLAFSLNKSLSPLGFLLNFAVLFWAVRLTLNWAYTFYGLNFQDWRYTMLKQKTGKLYFFVNFTGIHMVPTLVVYGCVLPAAYAVKEELTATPLSIVCLLISLGATVLQGTADIQMHKFRKNKNAVFIRNGLWKYSRHPNYLGEILMWWGVGLAVFFAQPQKPFLLIGAVLNTVLFLAVSIPLAEGKQAKKEGYDEYKKQTRALLPIKKISH